MDKFVTVSVGTSATSVEVMVAITAVVVGAVFIDVVDTADNDVLFKNAIVIDPQ